MMYLLYIKYNSNLDSEFKHESITLEEQTKKILDFIKEENIIQSSESLFKIPRNIKQYFYKISSCKKELDPINYEEEKITIQAINYKNGKLIFDAKTDLNDYLNEQEYELKIIYNNKEIPITTTKTTIETIKIITITKITIDSLNPPSRFAGGVLLLHIFFF